MEFTPEQIWLIVSSVVTVASVIARFTPTPVDDGILAVAVQIVNSLAFTKKEK